MTSSLVKIDSLNRPPIGYDLSGQVSQFHVYLPLFKNPFIKVSYEKALVGALGNFAKVRCQLYSLIMRTNSDHSSPTMAFTLLSRELLMLFRAISCGMGLVWRNQDTWADTDIIKY